MTPPLLAVDDLTVRYTGRGGTVRALEHVSLTLAKREIVGLVGESGCGKSTLARCIVGLVKPTAGTVAIAETNVWSLKPVDRRRLLGRNVGFVFQDPTSSLNPRLTVQQILQDPLAIHTVGTKAERRRRVAELVELVGLPSPTLTRRPSQLSGGQKQRVAIARAIALEPAMMIADEPTSALDVSVQNQILTLLLSLRDELDLSLLFISHNIQAVTYLADRIAVMYLGRMVEHGDSERVRYAPLHPYTNALLASNLMLTEVSHGRPLGGHPPSARNPPSGCPFRTRCERQTQICTEEFPDATTFDSDHFVHCWHPGQEQSAPGVGPVADRTRE